MKTSMNVVASVLLITIILSGIVSAAYASSDSEIMFTSNNTHNNTSEGKYDSGSSFLLNLNLNNNIKVDGELRANSRVTLSNGTIIIIKIGPEEAEQRAESRMNITDCEQNCTTEVKEERENGRQKVVYEVKGKEHVKLFGFIKTRSTVKANVDAETGEVTDVDHSWWSYLSVRDEAYYRS